MSSVSTSPMPTALAHPTTCPSTSTSASASQSQLQSQHSNKSHVNTLQETSSTIHNNETQPKNVARSNSKVREHSTKREQEQSNSAFSREPSLVQSHKTNTSNNCSPFTSPKASRPENMYQNDKLNITPGISTIATTAAKPTATTTTTTRTTTTTTTTDTTTAATLNRSRGVSTSARNANDLLKQNTGNQNFENASRSPSAFPNRMTQTPIINSSKNSTPGYSSPVKETKRVLLEYDPITRRKVLNTYEILREIGKGEHGKVKLAKDLINQELVAIKILNRKYKKERPSLRQRRDSKAPIVNEYERKIKREIAIMKKCRHKHIVALKEVLDDTSSHKIYMVLEYMEKGEIKWKRLQSDLSRKPCSNIDEKDIPCCGSSAEPRQPHHRLSSEEDLLSNKYSPNLTFKQSRKVFRDVLLGLEYLHMHGVVHRDIKPANLLVSADNVVKISDFGVSFASSLSNCEEGHLINEFDLAKTAGTPAFFAPELCNLDCDDNGVCRTSTKIDHRIDIWALGVTLFCLLFGKVPFNADSEFELFNVIVNKPLKLPESVEEFCSPGPVSQDEFELACDLLRKMLCKDPDERLTIEQIKEHPFTLMDLGESVESLQELFNLNNENGQPTTLDFNLDDCDIVTNDEINNAIIGVGARIKRSLVRAIKAGGLSESEIRGKFHSMEYQRSKRGSAGSSDESSSGYSNLNSSIKLNQMHNNHSVILSEQPLVASVSPLLLNGDSTTSLSKTGDESGQNNSNSQINQNNHQHNPHIPSQLSHQIPTRSSSSIAFHNPYSLTQPREGGKSILHEMIEPQSANSSRRGSAGGIEAPQIETKRNVGGNLYLKNQSVLETFKGIQQEDNKRRRSSLFNPAHSSTSNKSSISTDGHVAHAHSRLNEEQKGQDLPVQVQKSSGLAPAAEPEPATTATTATAAPPPPAPPPLVTPIPVPAMKPNFEFYQNRINRMDAKSDILSPTDDDEQTGKGGKFKSRGNFDDDDDDDDDDEEEEDGPFFKGSMLKQLGLDDQMENSFMSLPLNESFASLDSFNDDYLSMKYKEFAENGKDPSAIHAKQMLRRKSSFSEADLHRSEIANGLASRFENFNLANQMNRVGDNMTTLHAKKHSDEEGIAPGSGQVEFFSNRSNSDSCSSYSSNSSSSDEEDEVGDDDDNNNDSDDESDEEKLTLAFHSKVAPSNRPPFLSPKNRAKSHDSHLPFLHGTMQRVDDVAPVIFHTGSPEFEDVPSALMEAAPISNNLRVQTPTVINGGFEQFDQNISQNIGQNIDHSTGQNKANESNKWTSPTKDIKQRRKDSVISKIVANATNRSEPKTQQQLFRENIYNYQFNNHYKKAPIFSAFPDAVKHLDNDQQAILETSRNKFNNNRPSYYRSNSVAVGVLQHTSDDIVEDMIESRKNSASPEKNA